MTMKFGPLEVSLFLFLCPPQGFKIQIGLPFLRMLLQGRFTAKEALTPKTSPKQRGNPRKKSKKRSLYETRLHKCPFNL